MAYSGYLLKIKQSGNDYTFPLQYIEFGTFKTVLGIQDLDSYRDANGVLHRNALPHKIAKVEFQLRENIKASEYDTIMSAITSRYTKSAERKLSVDVFLPELATYMTDVEVYMPDPEVTIKRADENELVYATIRMAFIGY